MLDISLALAAAVVIIWDYICCVTILLCCMKCVKHIDYFYLCLIIFSYYCIFMFLPIYLDNNDEYKKLFS